MGSLEKTVGQTPKPVERVDLEQRAKENVQRLMETPKGSVDYTKPRPIVRGPESAGELPDVDLRRKANELKRATGDPRSVWQIFQDLKAERVASGGKLPEKRPEA